MLGAAFGWSGFDAAGLVVAGGIQGQVAQDLAGFDRDDGDVQVVDEHPHGGAGVDCADADVVQAGCVAQGDGAGGVDFVVADAPVPVAAGGGEAPQV